MRRMLDSGDSAGLLDAAHELAGSAANIGAAGVADLARQVETGGPPAAVDLLDRLGPELERAGRLLRVDLANQADRMPRGHSRSNRRPAD
jgi:HPt (histidine-containing phosphotransfer) domain-containing protein